MRAPDPAHTRADRQTWTWGHRDVADGNEQGVALLHAAAEAHRKGDIATAITGYNRALAVTPDNPDAWNNLGVALRAARRLHAAVACYHHALALRPDHAATYSNLGNALRELGEIEESLAAHRKAVALAPNVPDAVYNLGLALRDLAQNDDAIACFDRMLAAKPDNKECLWDRALSQLLLGDLKGGFPQYEWRWHLPYHPPRGFAQPQWDGGDLTGKTILLHHEQGFGDCLQFIRFCPRVKAKGATVIVECQPELVRLFERVAGVDRVVAAGSPLPPFDVFAPLLSLGALLGVDEKTIPTDIPYLSAPAGAGKAIAGQIAAFSERAFTVGIVWGGKATHRNDRNRSCAFDRFLALTAVPGTRFVSLQKGPKVAEMAEASCPALVADAGSHFEDFADAAAAIRELDLVLTVDTAVAHLAGALGKRCWVLIPFAPDWRWMMKRTDSPWYPSLTLYRQDAPGNWDGVFERIRSDLARAAAEKRP